MQRTRMRHDGYGSIKISTASREQESMSYHVSLGAGTRLPGRALGLVQFPLASVRAWRRAATRKSSEPALQGPRLFKPRGPRH